MRSHILLSLAMLLTSSAALGQTNHASLDDLTASALQSLVLDSSARLESYRFSMDMEQKIDLVNLSSGDAQKLYTRSFGYGLANTTARSLKLSMASLTYVEGDEDNTSVMALEEYLINDTIYLKVDGNWTTMMMPGLTYAWSQQNTMAQELEMFNQSRITLIGSEMVGGQDCYKVKAEMDTSTMEDQISGMVPSIVPMQTMNYSELFRNMSLEVHYWISKDTRHLKKADIVETFMLTPKYLGLPANESMEMRINADISMLFEGFNESINIKLPAEARKAQTFPMGLSASTEAVRVVPVGNETELNETMPENNITQAAASA